jgi:hypothetical protein
MPQNLTIPETKKEQIITLLHKENIRSKICTNKKYWNKSVPLTIYTVKEVQHIVIWSGEDDMKTYASDRNSTSGSQNFIWNINTALDI